MLVLVLIILGTLHLLNLLLLLKDKEAENAQNYIGHVFLNIGFLFLLFFVRGLSFQSLLFLNTTVVF